VQDRALTSRWRLATGARGSHVAIECSKRFVIHSVDDATSRAGALHTCLLRLLLAMPETRVGSHAPLAAGQSSSSNKGDERLVRGHDALSWGGHGVA